MIRAVLEANVFVSAVLSPGGVPARILKAWRANQFHLIISEAILQETAHALRYPRIGKRHQWTEEQIRNFIDQLAYFAILTPGDLHLSVIAEDPSDDRYIECAVEGAAA